MTEQELTESTNSIAKFAVEIIEAKNAEIAQLKRHLANVAIEARRHEANSCWDFREYVAGLAERVAPEVTEIDRLRDVGKYASMTPEERHAYCLNWVRGLNLTKERDIVTIVPGIEVYIMVSTMDKWAMVIDERKTLRISESFGLDGIGDVYPVFAIIRAIENEDLK